MNDGDNRLLASGTRAELLAVLREKCEKGDKGPWDAGALVLLTADRLERAQLIPPWVAADGRRISYGGLIPYLDRNDMRSDLWPELGMRASTAQAIRGVIWELLVQGVLCPGAGSWNQAHGHRHQMQVDQVCLTAQGEDIVRQSEDRVWAHDPDGYLAALCDGSGEPDGEMLRYVQEALAVFRHGHFLATAVLLGTASERLVEVFAERVRDALAVTKPGDSWYQTKFVVKRQVTDRFDALHSKLVGEYGAELKAAGLLEGLQRIVRLYFEVLRDARNEVAHASGRTFTWAEVSALVHGFVPYYKHVSAVMAALPSDSQ